MFRIVSSTSAARHDLPPRSGSSPVVTWIWKLSSSSGASAARAAISPRALRPSPRAATFGLTLALQLDGACRQVRGFDHLRESRQAACNAGQGLKPLPATCGLRLRDGGRGTGLLRACCLDARVSEGIIANGPRASTGRHGTESIGPAASWRCPNADIGRLLARIEEQLTQAGVDDRASLFRLLTNTWSGRNRWATLPILLLVFHSIRARERNSEKALIG